jgi:2-oxoglutarate dehydrogenase E1 component
MTEQMNIENLPYLEALWQRYLRDPSSLSDEWRHYFAQATENGKQNIEPLRTANVSSTRTITSALRNGKETATKTTFSLTAPTQFEEMIQAYRRFGHLKARIDPLNLRNLAVVDLEPEAFGFTESHMDKLFASESLRLTAPLTLRECVQWLENVYCGPIGFEFMHIADLTQKRWLEERIERIEDRSKLDRADQVRILSRLIDAQCFEQFIRKKFLGAKSFSLEGAESLIPLLEFAIEKAADQGVEEIVLAMAHRGRLNVLANILGKPPREIFREFIDPSVAHADGSGDVKYHLGHSHDYRTRAGREVHLSLCFNPSHLEFVNPVALGRVRAKQDRGQDRERTRGMALLIHGEAALAGEGIIQEALNLERLDPYEVGGVVHVVVNNQIGFTTPPSAARSTTYATDVMKMLQMPIFHVNGDEPEAVAYAVRLALEFRARFRQDVVIDTYCYRRLGHNEGDEPSFTQPLMYQAIGNKKNIREIYLERLLSLQRVTAEEAADMEAVRVQRLERELAAARDENHVPVREELQGIWAGYQGGLEPTAEELKTGIEIPRLTHLLEAQTQLPDDFHPHPKIARAMEARRKMAVGEIPLDWSAAESLVFASLASEGIHVRLSGQDSGRGTFSHRHAVLRDYQTGQKYVPLQHLGRDQASFEIYDSPLSEAGVLGFEYGYSLDRPDGLTLWEAQFGDFSNAAQVIIDQFITTAEEKWRRLSGLVMLLPHGFEGMGPEHSSARLERFLQLGARDNIQVIYPTTPAQYFHSLRRQALRKWRKPLIVMTPKSLLRHPKSVSPREEFSKGSFLRVIADSGPARRRSVKRILLCSGKIYFDLEHKRQELGRDDVAIIRLEQLYPFPEKPLQSLLAEYPAATPLTWVQEEPENMGAWWYLNLRFNQRVLGNRPVSVVARAPAASPATGSATRHKEQQQLLLNQAFGISADAPSSRRESTAGVLTAAGE